MDFSGEYRIPAPRQKVWEALNDPAILQQAIPGCESLEKTSDTELKAQVRMRVGPVSAKFGGKVTQLITVSVGLDDWEWGVTLWARNPAFLKEIVYTMRFDEASARFAEFGPFYTGYVSTSAQILAHCRISADT